MIEVTSRHTECTHFNLDYLALRYNSSIAPKTDRVVTVSRPLPRDGAWRKTKKPGNFPRPGPEVVERQIVAKERASQRVRRWTVKNEMK